MDFKERLVELAKANVEAGGRPVLLPHCEGRCGAGGRCEPGGPNP